MAGGHGPKERYGQHMRPYEVMVIIDADLEDETIRATVERWLTLIESSGAERGYIDAVITPHETRIEVVRALRLLATKRETLPPKKHGNIPL